MLRRSFARVSAIASLAAVLASSLAAPAAAQSTQWSPQRKGSGSTAVTVRTGEVRQAGYAAPSQGAAGAESAIRRAQYTADWQRSPRTTAAAAPRSGQPTVVTAQSNRRPPMTARRAYDGAGDGRTVSTQFGLQLNAGEQLVGQPTVNEGAGGGSAGADMLPTPDGVSTQGSPRSGTSGQGKIVHEGPIYTDGEIMQEGSPFPQDSVWNEGQPYADGEMMYDGGSTGGCASGCCGSGGCGSGGCASGICSGRCRRDEWDDPAACGECGSFGYHRLGCGRVAMCLDNCLGPLIREWSIFAGPQGFKGPVDLGLNGNFGFSEGFNLAGPIIPFPRCGLGYQIGARFVQSDLHGTAFGSSARHQDFLTAGVFHRAYRHCGLQWGVAYDWLNDNYYTKNSLAQVRGEVSFLFRSGNELGVWGTGGVKQDTNDANQNMLLQPTDQINLFYRHTTAKGGQGRLWGGFTGQSLFIIGADFRVPMSNRIDFVGGFNYIVPNAGQDNNGQRDESFGLMMNIVWYVGRRKEGTHNTPFRPLFNVADNNTLMLDQF